MNKLENIVKENCSNRFRDREIFFFVEFPLNFNDDIEFQSFTGTEEFNSYYRSDFYALEFFTGMYSDREIYQPNGWPSEVSDDLSEYYKGWGEDFLETGHLSYKQINELLNYYGIKIEDLNIFIQIIYKTMEMLISEFGEKTRLVYFVRDYDW